MAIGAGRRALIEAIKVGAAGNGLFAVDHHIAQKREGAGRGSADLDDLNTIGRGSSGAGEFAHGNIGRAAGGT